MMEPSSPPLLGLRTTIYFVSARAFDHDRSFPLKSALSQASSREQIPMVARSKNVSQETKNCILAERKSLDQGTSSLVEAK